MISDDSFDSTSSPDELYEDVDDTITETNPATEELTVDQIPSDDPELQELAEAREAFEGDTPPSSPPPHEQGADSTNEVALNVDQDSVDSDSVEENSVEEKPADASETLNESDQETDSLPQDDPRLVELGEPFVGQWNQLISTTNWDKGRIITAWRQALIDNEAPVTEYSDEAWVRRVGGVTSPHVGRLRRVHDR